MEVTIQPTTIKEYLEADGSGQVEVNATWNVSPQVARRKAGRLVGDRIGNLLFGGDPALVLGDRPIWRVPILLAYKGVGTVGQAGHVDIDAITGDPLYVPSDLDNIRRLAEDLADRYAPLSI